MSRARELEALGIDLGGRTSGKHKTLCPRCSDTRKKSRDRCLSVDIDRGLYSCKNPGCDFSGKAFDDTGRRTYTPPPRKVYRKPDPSILGASELSQGARDWLTKRGITAEVWSRNRLSSSRAFNHATGAEQNALAFPFYRDRALVYVKYRFSPKAFSAEAGAEPILYGIDDVDPREPLIWVEGEIDKLSCEVAGFRNCVSMPNGAPNPNAGSLDSYILPLESAAELIDRVDSHIIAVDNDPPGERLRDELVRRLGVERCRVAIWPDGCKDANDVLCLPAGASILASILNAAPDVPVSGLLNVSEVAPMVDHLYHEGLTPGLDCGVPEVDKLYTTKPGQLTIVTGIPGHGKSAFVDWLIVRLAERHDWRFAVYSPENQPIERHISQFIQLYAGLPFRDGPTQRMTLDEMREARDWVDRHIHFISSTDEDMNIDDILDRARIALLRYGINGLVIDPWTEIDHQRPQGATETEYISRSLSTIRAFARRSEIHTWVVAHPTKLAKVDDKYPVPTLYDVAGSANWRNKADMGIAVWRDPGDNSRAVDLHVQKVRFAECGKVGKVRLYHDILTGRYSTKGEK